VRLPILITFLPFQFQKHNKSRNRKVYDVWVYAMINIGKIKRNRRKSVLIFPFYAGMVALEVFII